MHQINIHQYADIPLYISILKMDILVALYDSIDILVQVFSLTLLAGLWVETPFKNRDFEKPHAKSRNRAPGPRKWIAWPLLGMYGPGGALGDI